MKKLFRTVTFYLVITFLYSCATNSTIELPAKSPKPKKEIINLDPIPILATYNKSAIHYQNDSHKKESLVLTAKKRTPVSVHIYIGGDGNVLHKPLFSSLRPSKNPTSRSPTASKLMRSDKNPSIYLSRPCHDITPLPSECNSEWWTTSRYSKKVINLMSLAIDHIKKNLRIEKVTLIGHSGGGVIATILAGTRSDVDGLITIASNIDHTLWTNSLGYSPLTGSLNAVDFLPLHKDIQQIHLVGGLDNIVPAQITIQALSKDTRAKPRTFPKFNHTCCWKTVWSDVLTLLQSSQGTSPTVD